MQLVLRLALQFLDIFKEEEVLHFEIELQQVLWEFVLLIAFWKTDSIGS